MSNPKRILRTLKGSAIKRSRLGVGKDIGGEIYLHRQYEHLVPDQVALAEAKRVLEVSFPGVKYNALKFSKDGFTFFTSPDFDTVDEPEAGYWVRIHGGLCKSGTTRSIWHHKWLWVDDDYAGFDVEASFRRSQAWLSIPDIDFSRIGNRAFWNEKVVPFLLENS